MPQILIAEKCHPLLIEGLQNLGYTCVLNETIPQNELENCIANFEGLIVRGSLNINAQVLSLATNLKFIGRPGSGLDNIDLEFAKSKNIQCLNSPEGNCTAVAEHALGMLLAFQKNIIQSNQQMENEFWLREANRGKELSQKTVGIIGYGYTGKAFAKLLQGFGCKVLVYDKWLANFGNEFVVETDLETIQAQAEVISFHVSLNKDTKFMADAAFFNKCNQQPLIINTSRGLVLNLTDLLQALEHKTIAGACLDVFEAEPFLFEDEPYKKLLRNKKIICTPHIAGWSVEALCKMSAVLLQKIQNNIRQ